MKRSARVVLLCEDRQHKAFARRFLKGMGWETRGMRVEKSPAGRGSGVHFVVNTFPKELVAYRQNRGRVAEALVVVTDGNSVGVSGRVADLDEACGAARVTARGPDDRVAVFVPT